MSKFALMMLGVTPLFCSDLCAYAYDRCVTAIGFRAVRVRAKPGIKSASHSHSTESHSSGSGCSCGGVGRGYSEDDQDDGEDFPRGNGVSNIKLQMDGNRTKDLYMRYMEMEGNKKNDPFLRYSNPIQIPKMDGTGRNEPTGSEVIHWDTSQ